MRRAAILSIPFVALALARAQAAPLQQQRALQRTAAPSSRAVVTRRRRAAAAIGRADLLVLAPHPDDESLIAAGVLAEAVRRGQRVAVAFVTNGDLGCDRDGYLRQREALAALGRLGVPPDSIYFLGFPDGHLAELGSVPLPPVLRRDALGRCVLGNTTYAWEGDVHSLVTSGGEPGDYRSATLVEDLAALLERVQPRDVYVSHPLDQHLDHAYTYTYLRRALERVSGWRASGLVVHRALVHLEGCWPMGPTPRTLGPNGKPSCPPVRFQPDEPMPELPPPYERYRPNELVPVPAAMRRPELESNLKAAAISAHRSQVGDGPELSYLYAFVRPTEGFWRETLVDDGEGGLRRQRAQRKAPVRCSFTASVEPAEAPTNLRPLGGACSYALRSEAHAIVLLRNDGRDGRDGRELRRWPLPLEPPGGAHTYSLAVDPRPDENGLTELTLRRDRELLGVALDGDTLSPRKLP